ncbi:MAG TPA: hypothetical protein VF789_12585 [Thermoanaerobaculia bacterium]
MMIKKIFLSGHFDGNQIQLDEPHELQPGTPLMIVVGPPGADEGWYSLSARALKAAYEGDEPGAAAEQPQEPPPTGDEKG